MAAMVGESYWQGGDGMPLGVPPPQCARNTLHCLRPCVSDMMSKTIMTSVSRAWARIGEETRYALLFCVV